MSRRVPYVPRPDRWEGEVRRGRNSAATERWLRAPPRGAGVTRVWRSFASSCVVWAVDPWFKVAARLRTGVLGTLLAFVIWRSAVGFGGPYTPGSTDIGAAVIYVLVFAGLFVTNAGLYVGLDARLTPAPGRWGFLAAGGRNPEERARRELARAASP